MTCLYIAIKLLVGTTTMTTTTNTNTTGPSGTTKTKVHVMKVTIHTFVEMSKHYYSRAVMERTERDIVNGLNWYLHAPTSTSYVRLIMQLLSYTFVHPMHETLLSLIECTAYETTEWAIVDTYFCYEKAIDIALASIHHAIRITQQQQQQYQMLYYRNHHHHRPDDVATWMNQYWNAILYHLPIVQGKLECRTFRRIYMALGKVEKF
jgi:hypothetical protein